MELIDKNEKIQHLAGIVPIGGQPLEFDLPWDDCLLPLSSDYLAVERAVYQCAIAGCETVWIVGYLGTQPIVRKRVGDILLDPLTITHVPNVYDRVKEISVYYVPVHPKDRSKRDCLGWSVLHGADSAYRIANFITKWIAPEKFFCSFPYGIVPDDTLHQNRLLMSSKNNVTYSHKGKTVKNNIHLPFTFDAQDYFRCRDIVKHKQGSENGRDSARHYDLATVFSGLDSDNSRMVELPWFYDVSTWEGYKKFLASEHSNIKKPKNLFKGLRRREL